MQSDTSSYFRYLEIDYADVANPYTEARRLIKIGEYF